MLKKITFSLATVALAAAGAASSHRLTLFQNTVVNGTELKAGEYKVELRDDKVLISGRQKVEAPVKTETSDSKFSSTSVKLRQAGGKYHITEIRVGGTNTKLVFEN